MFFSQGERPSLTHNPKINSIKFDLKNNKISTVQKKLDVLSKEYHVPRKTVWRFSNNGQPTEEMDKD
jgi:hypothetical protein